MRYCGWLLILALAARGQDSPPPPLPAPDPDIRHLLTEISADRIQRSVFVLTSFKTRHTLSDSDPAADGIGAAAGWIRTQFLRSRESSGGRLIVREDTFTQKAEFPRLPHSVQITNLVATLPGSRPGSARRVYVVSAHYDSRAGNPLDADGAAPGADEDASGVAAVLELARVLSRYPFPATIVFLVTSGEEQGLLGSAHWAAQARREGEDIEGVLNNDCIGNSHGRDGRIERDRVRLFAQGVPPARLWTQDEADLIATGAENDLPARQLARAIIDCAKVYEPGMDVQLIYRADRYLHGGDEQSFLDQGYAAVRFAEPWEDSAHEHEDVRVENGVQYGDVTDGVDFVYVAGVARVNAAALASLARAPAPPRDVRMDVTRPENDTTLRWEPNHEADLAGYRVVWRDTTAPFWQHFRDLPADRTRVTLPINKDDVVFGVESFDTDGHVSLAVYPVPRRTP